MHFFSQLLISHLLMLLVSSSSIAQITAKILAHNTRSIRFFEKYGFVREAGLNAFNELTLVYKLK